MASSTTPYILLDTHALIFWHEGSVELSPLADHLIRNALSIFICAISLWEVVMLDGKGRVSLAPSPLQWMRDVLKDPRVQLVDLTPEIATRTWSIVLHGDPADRIIAATSAEMGIPLLTRDGKLQALPHLDTRW